MGETYRRWVLALLAGTLEATIAVARTELSGPDQWGGIPSHPAVVNPSVPAAAPGDLVSLRGEWEFSNEVRENGHWRHDTFREWKNARKIAVPGCWEAQGVGEPGMGVPWFCADQAPKALRHRFIGVGWYRRRVRLPENWRGKRVWIKFGGVRALGWCWVNGTPVAHLDTYCGTYKFDVTHLVCPGEETVVVLQVDNRRPSRRGQVANAHCWGGICRDIEFEATPCVFVDDAWVRGDYDARVAEVHVDVAAGDDFFRLRNLESENRGQVSRREEVPDLKPVPGARRMLRVTIDGQSVEKPLADVKADAVGPLSSEVVRVPLANFRPWSPESPNLYTAKVELVENGTVSQMRCERFGVRKLEVCGEEFRLNGRPIFMRGYGDDSTYPLQGLSPADCTYHREHFAVARRAGFNYVRLHTHCEVPEYFEAADEMGFLIQPELPYYNDFTPEFFNFDPKRDVTELYRHFRRHPSFAVYSMGNEDMFPPALNSYLHEYVKAMDPDRLKIQQDAQFVDLNPPEWADFTSGPVNIWGRGHWNPHRPFLAHEYLNLCVKTDSRQESRYTGVWLPLETRRQRAEWIAKFGLDAAWGDRLQDAQHALQRYWQKRGLESARADPYCDGYIFWTIADVGVQQGSTYTAQGMFDVFWGVKPKGFSPEDVALFNGASCVLLDTPDEYRILTSGERLSADFLFARYGALPRQPEKLVWKLDVPGAESVCGTVRIGEIPEGNVRKVAAAEIPMPSVPMPARGILSADVGGVSNRWDVWVFPKRIARSGRSFGASPALQPVLGWIYPGLLPSERAAEAKLVFAEWGSAFAKEALARGQRVIAFAGADGNPEVRLGWWSFGCQVGTALASHPVLKGVPHEGFLSPLLFRTVLGSARDLPMPGLTPQDVFVVREGGNACYVHLAQGRYGKGLLLASFGLRLPAETPEGLSLLDGMVDYAVSEGFRPTGEFREMK